MEIYRRLCEIWSQDYIATLPAAIGERGFDYSENEAQKDILITGINPSFDPREAPGRSFHFGDILFDRVRKSRYWQPIKKMLCDADIDLRDRAAYLDLFYFREKEQGFLRREILPNPAGIRFLVDQANLTQHIIEEVVKPKLIVVANKESAAYWGKHAEEGIIWMGYDLRFVKRTKAGELYRIAGLLDSAQRVGPEFRHTNIRNSFILFSQHIKRFTPAEKRPTAQMLQVLSDYGAAYRLLDEI